MADQVMTYIIGTFGNKSYVDQIQMIAALVNNKQNKKELFDKYQKSLINMYIHLAHNLKEEKKSYQGVFSLLLDNYKIPYGHVLDIVRKVYPEEAPVNYGVAAAAGAGGAPAAPLGIAAGAGAPLAAQLAAPLAAPLGMAAGAGGAPAAEEAEEVAAAAALQTIAANNTRKTAANLLALKSSKGGKRQRRTRRRSTRRRHTRR